MGHSDHSKITPPRPYHTNCFIGPECCSIGAQTDSECSTPTTAGILGSLPDNDTYTCKDQLLEAGLSELKENDQRYRVASGLSEDWVRYFVLHPASAS